MIKLVESHDRSVYYLPDTRPAVFYLADRDAGGVLVNSPAFDADILARLQALAPLRYVFYPSRFGVRDLEAWRAAGAETLAYGHEARAIDGQIDLVLDRENKFSRTIDFLPMSGRTEASCALRCRNKPGMVFFGPILATGEAGWPTLIPAPDDYSYENRLFGALGIKDVRFEYAFTDDYDPARSHIGPGADVAVHAALERVLMD
jgi:hypothetical protein